MLPAPTPTLFAPSRTNQAVSLGPSASRGLGALGVLPDELLIDLILPAAVGPATALRSASQARDAFLPGFSQASHACRLKATLAAGALARRLAKVEQRLALAAVQRQQGEHAEHAELQWGVGASEGALSAARQFLRAVLPEPGADWCAAGHVATMHKRKRAAERVTAAMRGNALWLNLDWLSLTSMPPHLAYCASVRELSAHGNHFGSMPKELQALTLLDRLVLSSAGLSSPGLLPALSAASLTRLDLSNNQLAQLPANIDIFVNLQQVHIERNRLTELPAGLFAGGQLTKIWASSNLLQELPVALCTATKLTLLNVSNNPLFSLPSNIGLLKSLQYFRAEKCHIDRLPASVVAWRSLHDCRLGENNLTSLPAGFEKMTCLRHLELQFNCLASLPQSLPLLPRLGYLNLSNNDLASLPGWLDRWPALRSVDLQDNPLRELPEVFGLLRPLTINIYGTPPANSLRAHCRQRYLQSRQYLPLEVAIDEGTTAGSFATVLF